MEHTLIHGDCLDVAAELRNGGEKFDCVFADPPDNIGLGYPGFDDNRPVGEYIDWLGDCMVAFLRLAPIVWVSYNAKWTYKIGPVMEWLRTRSMMLEIKPCVQTYTFYQHNKNDFGNAHRPLVRLRRNLYDSEMMAPIYSEQTRVPSWRQQNGDKRADSRGKVPGDVFDFPRVVGNSKQRRSYCKTQLHEGLVERCILQSTREGESVLDPFAGTGTTLRACKKINRECTLVEQSLLFCNEIAREHNLIIKEYVDGE